MEVVLMMRTALRRNRHGRVQVGFVERADGRAPFKGIGEEVWFNSQFMRPVGKPWAAAIMGLRRFRLERLGRAIPHTHTVVLIPEGFSDYPSLPPPTGPEPDIGSGTLSYAKSVEECIEIVEYLQEMRPFGRYLEPFDVYHIDAHDGADAAPVIVVGCGQTLPAFSTHPEIAIRQVEVLSVHRPYLSKPGDVVFPWFTRNIGKFRLVKGRMYTPQNDSPGFAVESWELKASVSPPAPDAAGPSADGGAVGAMIDDEPAAAAATCHSGNHHSGNYHSGTCHSGTCHSGNARNNLGQKSTLDMLNEMYESACRVCESSAPLS